MATIAVVGVSGKMGRLLSAALLSHPNVQVHGICRNPSKIASDLSSNPNFKAFEASSDDSAALRRGLAGTSACICAYLGDNNLMVDGQKTLIDACIEEKVPRYIASDWSLDFRGLEMGQHPAKDPMKIIQAYLEEKEAEGKIKGVHIINGCFMEVFWAPFVGFVNAKQGKFWYWGTGDEPIELTRYEDAANYTAEVALDPAANGFLNVVGDKKSIKEIAAVFKERYGGEPTLEKKGSLDDLYNTMIPVFKKDPQNIYSWMGMFYQYYMLNGSTLARSHDNDRYPSFKAQNIEMFLKNHSQKEIEKSSFF